MSILAAIALLALPSFPLQVDSAPLRMSDLVLERYAVQNVDPGDLYRIAKPILGRRLLVQDNGPEADPVPSLQQLGRLIVLYDTAERVAKAREMLARLDAPRPGRSEPDEELEYRPRFVSLRSLAKALEDRIDVTSVEERGFLLLAGQPEELKAALMLAGRIDVPEKQVLLICQLVEVGSQAQAPALPKDLLENLQRLLPGSAFTQVGLAMLKTSVASRNPTSVQIETPGKRYRLTFEPVAFDEKSGALTVSNCTLVEDREGATIGLFSTDAVLGPGYTVLAATGASVRLLVVRVVPQG
jgi:hypothetical protein